MKKRRVILPFVYIALIAVVALLMFSGLSGSNKTQKDISSSEFRTMLEEGKFSYVLIVNQSTAYCVTKENPHKIDLTQDHEKLNKTVTKNYEYKASVDFTDSLEEALEQAKKAEDESLRLTDYDINYASQPWIVQLLPYIFLLVITGVIMFFMYSQMAGNGKAMQFGRSTAKMYDDSKKKVTFKDVAGADEEKEELAEIVDFLKKPDKFTQMGARIPKGVLLVGPPGTGKTLLAKSVAGEAGVPFFSITGSDFVELYVGIGAARVRDLFGNAKRNAPCIIFIDEIDAVGRRRGSGIGGGHDEREQTLNQLLVEMDGFVGNDGIIVMAATNRADILDPALLRSGRFDRQIHVMPPDVKGREEIFRIHARNKHFASDVSAREVALLTGGFVGADIENLCNEAALLAVRRGEKEITMQDIKDSITRVLIGTEKKSHKQTDEERRQTAFHEAGHAIIAHLLKNCDPVTEVSIIPRGGAGGYTLTRPENEKNYYSRSYFLDTIVMTFGGRAAEKLIFGDVTTGPSSDIRHATELAKGFVTKYGMNDEIGPIYLGDNDGEEIFLGRDFAAHKAYSEALSGKVDTAIHDLICAADQKAYELLKENETLLRNVAEVLLDREKISGDTFRELCEGKTPAELRAEEEAAEAAKVEQPTETAEIPETADKAETPVTDAPAENETAEEKTEE